jgi:hypothetical protein
MIEAAFRIVKQRIAILGELFTLRPVYVSVPMPRVWPRR